MHIGDKVIITGDHHGKQTQQFRGDTEGKKGVITKPSLFAGLWWVQLDDEKGPLLFNESEMKGMP